MKKIKILSTKKLSKDLKYLFDDLKFDLYHDDFISIQLLRLNLPKHNGSWIFTSKNAVEAVFSSNQNIGNFFIIISSYYKLYFGSCRVIINIPSFES